MSGKVRLLSRSFAGGEITPELVDRVDLGQQQTGLAECINAIIAPHGPAIKRGGTRYINRAKYWWDGEESANYSRNVQLIPFQFAADQSYLLEFGHEYIRFHTEGGTLLAGVNVTGEFIRSEGVASGPANKLLIQKRNHGLIAGQRIRVTVTPTEVIGTSRGSLAVGDGVPVLDDISKNDYWTITDSGTLLGRPVVPGYLLRAKSDDPYTKAVSTDGSITGGSFTNTTHGTGTFALGMKLFGTGITDDVFISNMNGEDGQASGDVYTVDDALLTVSSIEITGRAVNSFKWEIVPMEDWSALVDYDVDVVNAGDDDEVDPDAFAIDVDSTLTGGTPPTKTFTKITRAKQAVVKAVAHGFSNDDIVYFTLTNKNPAKVKFNTSIPYKVSDATTNEFKIKYEVEIDEDGNTEWQYLNTKKGFGGSTFSPRIPRGYINSTAFVPDAETAAVTYTVIRGVDCDGDVTFTQASHNFYTGQTVWLEPEAVDPWLKEGYYEVEVLTDDDFSLKEIDGTYVTGPTGYAGDVFPVYEVETPYASDDIRMLDYTQSYDVLTIAHKNYPPATIRRYGASDWEYLVEPYIPTVDVPTQVSATVTGTGGTVRPIYYAVTAVENDEESYPTYIERPAVEATEISGRIVYNIVPQWMGDGYYNDPVTFQTATGQGIKIDSGKLNIGQLIRLDAGDDASDDFIAAVEGDDMNDNLYRVVARLRNGWYVLARRSKTAFDWTAYEGPLDSGVLDVYRSGSVNADFDNNYRVLIGWKTKPGATYNIYKRVGNAGGDTLGFIGRTDNGYFTDDGITPDTSITPPMGESPFEIEGNYPACVDYFEQRKAFAGTENRPQNVWMTRTATERNMLQSIPVRDTDAIHFRMAGREQNAIKFMAALQDLILFTENAEWRVSATEGSVVTPASIMVRQQSANGCADVKPVVANSAILFVQSGSNRVLQLNYNWNAQSYEAGDISMLAYHLFEGREIVVMTIERGSFPVLWCVRDDGVLLGLTYVPGQNVIAWHRHTFGGDVLAARAIKEANGPVLYLAVRRALEQGNRILIERMDNYTAWRDRDYMDSLTVLTVVRNEAIPVEEENV